MILAQEYFDNQWSQQRSVVYTVPVWLKTSIETLVVNYPNSKTNNDKSNNYQYFIRIVKRWDTLDPNTLSTSDSKVIAYETNKNMFIARPQRNYKDFPDIYSNIRLDEWDSVVIKVQQQWMAVSLYWEEYEFNTDDIVEALQDINTSIIASTIALWNITGAINNIDCQCNCS